MKAEDSLAATRVVAEWFSTKERATAMGIINGGSAVGAVIAPPLIALILIYGNWRWIFVATGLLGMAWTIWWRHSYFPPEEHPRLKQEEREKLAATPSSFRFRIEFQLDRPAQIPADMGCCAGEDP